MRKKQNYEERKCEICPRVFYVHKHGVTSNKNPNGIRPWHSKTCSRKCSRIYVKILQSKNTVESWKKKNINILQQDL